MFFVRRRNWVVPLHEVSGCIKRRSVMSVIMGLLSPENLREIAPSRSPFSRARGTEFNRISNSKPSAEMGISERILIKTGCVHLVEPMQLRLRLLRRDNRAFHPALVASTIHSS